MLFLPNMERAFKRLGIPLFTAEIPLMRKTVAKTVRNTVEAFEAINDRS